MEGKGSNDPKPWSGKPETKRLGGGSGSLSEKMSDKLEKTKVVAATGVKKVKDKATVGVNWIKLKYHAHKLGQKK